MERVQPRDVDPVGEVSAHRLDPIVRDGPESARDGLEEPGSGMGTAGQVLRPGHLFLSAPTWGAVMPGMLVHAEDLHFLDLGRVIGGCGRD